MFPIIYRTVLTTIIVRLSLRRNRAAATVTAALAPPRLRILADNAVIVVVLPPAQRYAITF